MSIIPLFIGLTAGIISGLVGIGGGVLMIPALIIFLGYSQHMAQGTTLAAMVPPIGILAAWVYYQQGHVNVPAALLISLGFIAGGFFGAKFAVEIPPLLLKRIFGITLMILALRMIIWE